MSIEVPLDELAERLRSYPWGYLVTVRDDGRAQSLAVPTRLMEGALVATVGRGTASNATARPNITLLFPGSTGEDFSLIVDGDAEVDGDQITVTPAWAVLHRPALMRTAPVDRGEEAAPAVFGTPSAVDQGLVHRLLHPSTLADATSVLARPSAAPSASGIYAWYFDQVPPSVPTDGCHRLGESWLLYVGISPKKPSSAGKESKQNLQKRLSNHYSGNASGSTLRLTLGSLLREELGIELRETRGRWTFGEGEEVLSAWMAGHARVSWVTDPQPWILEDHLIETLSLPLNLQGNAHHPFQATLSAARRAARTGSRSAS